LRDFENSEVRQSTILEELEVTGESLFSDKVKFTQTDGNEYIDSLADGYMDYGATTQHRFNNDVKVTGAISSATATVTASADNTDVSGVNTLWVTTAGEMLFWAD